MIQTQPISSQKKLKPEQKAILRDLLRVGATTASKFEIKTNRIGVNVTEELDSLHDSGLIGKKEQSGIFYPTIKTWLTTYFS